MEKKLDVAQRRVLYAKLGERLTGQKTLDDTERLVNLISKLRSETAADIEEYLEKPEAPITDSKG